METEGSEDGEGRAGMEREGSEDEGGWVAIPLLTALRLELQT